MKITKHSNPSWRDEFRRSLLDMYLRKYVVVVGGVVVGVDCVIHPCYLFFDLQFFFYRRHLFTVSDKHGQWEKNQRKERGGDAANIGEHEWYIECGHVIFLLLLVCVQISANMWYVDIFIFIVQHDEQRLHRVLGSPRERSSMCVHTSTTQSG